MPTRYCLFLCLLLFTSSAYANLFNTILNDIKDAGKEIWHEMNTVYANAARAEKEFHKSAMYVEKQALNETVDFAKKAGKEIEQAAKITADFLLNMDKIGKTCEGFYNDLGGKALASVFPYPDHLQEFKALSTLDCRMHYTSGFACGVYPYIADFAKAVANGKAATEGLARYISKAYNKKPCNKLNPISRQQCAVVLGLGYASADGQTCMGNVIKDIAKNGKRSSFKLDNDKINKFCTETGEFVFSMVADYALAGATSEQMVGKLFKVAKVARTAFNTSEKVASNSHVKKICTEKASHHATKVKRKKRLWPLGPNPGSHLHVLHNLSNPKCLHWNPKEGKVKTWNCGPWSTQKWSFWGDGRIMNDYGGPKSCLTAKKGKVLTAGPCGNTKKDPPKNQKFKIHKGEIKNIATGQCLKSGNDGNVYDKACDDTYKERWYTSLPKAGPLTLKPAEGVQLFVGKSKPLCLDNGVKSGSRRHFGLATCENKGNQKWTIHSDGRFTLASSGRRHHPFRCVSANSHTIGKTLTGADCKSSKESYQHFDVIEGGLIKYRTNENLCATRYYRKKYGIYMAKLTKCNKNDENQKWYMF